MFKHGESAIFGVFRGENVKYHDSINQANSKLSEVIQHLQRWKLPVNPVNYAIAYEFVSNNNPQLTSDINQHLEANSRVDNFFFEELHQQYILGQSTFRAGIIHDIDNMVDDIQQNCSDSESSVSSFVQEIDNNIGNITRANSQQLAQIAHAIKKATIQVKTAQLDLSNRLERSKEKVKDLKVELEEVQNVVFQDPLTGLYNRKAMQHHVDLWYKNGAPPLLAAIVLNIDDFNRFNDKFGHLISDVILSKISSKVISYVDDSGLPVRYGSDEFLILLPDVDANGAGEIAEKIRQGVEKLRFVSAKSRVRLPKLTVSLGVTDISPREAFPTLIKKAKRALLKAQQRGINQVNIVNS